MVSIVLKQDLFVPQPHPKQESLVGFGDLFF